ncbi:MAG TPA: NADP-dependent oxidoreductase [Solirubrobacteraceae bacterium]|nr:NADP-dependent oxidoreductase [Solirubrobacteraceae bacterium]
MSDTVETPQMEEATDTRTTEAPPAGDPRNGTMRAISQDELGGPDVLKLVTLPIPEPGVSQILIRVHAAGVNPIDGANRQTGAFVGQPPFVLGWDVSGTVEAVGPGVTLYKPGDAVFGLLPFPQGHGAYAEHVVGPTRAFVLKPDQLDHVQAAAIPMVGLTAWQALVDTADVHQGSRVLITGAAGGIGHLAVQIAKARGAHVTALASAADLDFVRSLGADEAIDYNATDFTQVVGDQDVVLDVVGGDYPARALDVLKPGGIVVSTQPPAVAAVAETAAGRNIRAAGIIVEADQVGMSALAELAAAGKLVPAIAATFPLENAVAASATADLAAGDGHFPLEEGGAAESGKHGPGKVVLTIM